MTAPWILGVLTALLAVWTVVRIVREPRRVRNGLFLVATLFFLWFTVVVRELQDDPESPTAVLLVYGALALGVLAVAVVGVLLLLNGAVVVRREGLGVSTLVPAVFGTALLGTVAALVIGLYLIGDSGRHPLLSQILLFVIAPVGGFTVAMFLVELVAFTVYALLYSRITRPRHADAVVVLGAGLRGTEPTPLLAARIDRGVAMLRELRDAGSDAVLVLSGGQGADEVVSEAEAMARYAERAGVPRERMVLEDRSTTTEENLRNSRALLASRGAEDARMVVVTSNYHALRAAQLTEQLGLDAEVVGARTASWFVPAGFLREFVAVVAMYRRANVRVWTVCTVLWLLFVGVVFLLSALQSDPGTVDALDRAAGLTSRH